MSHGICHFSLVTLTVRSCRVSALVITRVCGLKTGCSFFVPIVVLLSALSLRQPILIHRFQRRHIVFSFVNMVTIIVLCGLQYTIQMYPTSQCCKSMWQIKGKSMWQSICDLISTKFTKEPKRFFCPQYKSYSMYCILLP